MDLLDVLAKMKEEPSSRATCERWVKNNPSAELGFENNDLVIFIGDFRPRKFTIAYDELMFTDWRILPQPQQKSLGRIACDTFYDGCTDAVLERMSIKVSWETRSRSRFECD